MTIKIQSAFLLLILSGLLLAGCKKVPYQADVQNYYPKAGATSASIQPDGSVVVTGNVVSEGLGGLYYAGFCMDVAPGPQMHINQKLATELNGTTFNATYQDLDGNKRYYVRSFVANEYGFAYGDEVIVDHPAPDTASIACHPADKTIMVETSSYKKVDDLYDVTAFDPTTHGFEVNSFHYGYGLRFEFGKIPISGTYTIWEHATLNSNEVAILYSDANGSNHYMDDGGSIRVQQIDAIRYRIWICHQDAGRGTFVTTAFTTK